MAQIGWIDSHTHLADEVFDEDRDEVIARLHEFGIKHVNLIGESPESLNRSLQYAASDSIFDVSCGLHPADLNNYSLEDINYYTQMASDPRIVAIGEIGLDYHWTPETKELQKREFIRQIDLANAVKKPVIIHTRDAIQDTYDILKEHRPVYGCIMHAYSGSYEMALEFIKLGCMISIGGVVTFKNAKDVKKVAELIPLDRLLIETDAPYLTPTPFRGKRNEASYVRFVGEEIAKIRNISIEELQNALLINYRRCFKPEYFKNKVL